MSLWIAPHATDAAAWLISASPSAPHPGPLSPRPLMQQPQLLHPDPHVRSLPLRCCEQSSRTLVELVTGWPSHG